MDSLPVELVDIILGYSYDIYNLSSEYINGLLVCSLWRDIMQNDSRYINIKKYIIAADKLPMHIQHAYCRSAMIKSITGIKEYLAKTYSYYHIIADNSRLHFKLNDINWITIKFKLRMKIVLQANGTYFRRKGALNESIMVILESTQLHNPIRDVLTNILAYIS